MRVEATVAGIVAGLSKRHFDMDLSAELAYLAVVDPTVQGSVWSVVGFVREALACVVAGLYCLG